MEASSERMGNHSSSFEKADGAYSTSAQQVHGQKEAANIVKPMLTRIYRKKCVNGSENSGTSKK
jgi:hypothetical protein